MSRDREYVRGYNDAISDVQEALEKASEEVYSSHSARLFQTAAKMFEMLRMQVSGPRCSCGFGGVHEPLNTRCALYDPEAT